MTSPFTYPTSRHVRRHGPQGYADPASYRPWLRDEFAFRCVYCLLREQWGLVRGTFDIEHFQPVALHPDKATVYDNLLYSCATCNAAKGSQRVPDPCRVMLRPDVRVDEDGTIRATSPEARRLIRRLGLDDPEYTEFRLLWIGITVLAALHAPDLWRRFMGFPDDLPDLGRLRPPQGNTLPEGVARSYFRQRERGALPTTY
jgi:hypothetical protein